MSIIATNKKAHFDYEVLETLEAGLVLSGAEVKSIKQGSVNLKGSFVTFHDNEAYLTNAHVSPYSYAPLDETHDPTQRRKLLLHRKEVDYLYSKFLEKGLTIIPLQVYTNHHLIKVEIGVCRGRHTYNKKEVLKKRDTDRELRRTLKE
jgi:SsrA-binding protein